MLENGFIKKFQLKNLNHDSAYKYNSFYKIKIGNSLKNVLL